MQTEKPLSPEREAALLQDRDNPAAIDELIRCNQALILYVVKHYNFPCGDQSMDDLLQLGSIGILRAVTKWDGNRAGKFSTYAVYWIRHEIQRHISAGSDFTVPVHVRQNVARVYRARSWLEQELQHEPTIEEIAQRSGMPVEFVSTWLDRANSLELDRMAGDYEDGSVYEVIAAEGDTPEEVIEKRDTIQSIREAMKLLPERDREIFTRRYFFDPPQTFNEIGQALNISKQYVMERDRAAKRKIKSAMNLL